MHCRYQAASAKTRTVFARFDPHYEAGSLDEAYLDVTAYCQQHNMTGEQVCVDGRCWTREKGREKGTVVNVQPNSTHSLRYVLYNPLQANTRLRGWPIPGRSLVRCVRVWRRPQAV